MEGKLSEIHGFEIKIVDRNQLVITTSTVYVRTVLLQFNPSVGDAFVKKQGESIFSSK